MSRLRIITINLLIQHCYSLFCCTSVQLKGPLPVMITCDHTVNSLSVYVFPFFIFYFFFSDLCFIILEHATVTTFLFVLKKDYRLRQFGLNIYVDVICLQSLLFFIYTNFILV